MLLTIAVARLLAEDEGVKQSDVADRLGITQPHVSRLRDAAIRAGFLTTSPRFERDRVSPVDLEEVDRRYFGGRDLIEALSREVPQGITFEAHLLPDGDQAFVEEASDRVFRLLQRSSTVGIMSGQTVSRLIEALGRNRSFREGITARRIDCIPLCGDPVHLLNQRAVRFSASNLAGELETILTGSRSQHLPSLIGVPAYVSQTDKIGGRRRQLSWWSFIRAIPGYQRIFGRDAHDQAAMVWTVDTILTGAGILRGPKGGRPSSSSAFIDERVVQGDGDYREIEQFSIGDLGGLLLPRDPKSERHCKQASILNAGWTGANLDHLRSVAAKASANGHPGIVLISEGSPKAELVLEIVRRGLANVLLCDSSLAAELRRMLKLNQGTRRRSSISRQGPQEA